MKSTPDTRLAARSVSATSALPGAQWNALLTSEDTPFIRHEFLRLLEDSGCVGQGTGWYTAHVVIERVTTAEAQLSAVMPLYVKEHSYGEYVFDWAWARAYQQHGVAYYPKLLCAIPFTPVTSRKLLVTGDEIAFSRALIDAAAELARSNSFSSVHAVFLDDTEAGIFENAGYLLRHDHQFHWTNEGFADFDDFLSRFTAKRRKTIRAERRKVADAGVTFRWLTAAETRERDWLTMYDLYRSTILAHGGHPYLTREFFLGLPSAMGERVLLLTGAIDGCTMCGALYFRNDNALFGRYWGADRFLSNLHFESCYYQPIAYAIAQGLTAFEAGAQGIHKLSRGLAPAVTTSAHWLEHPGFYDAVDRYLATERREQAEYARLLEESLPFKSRDD